MKKVIKLSKSCVSKKEIKAVNQVLKLEFLGMGKFVEKFENELHHFFNNNVATVINGTAAIQLALEACDIGKGDEVIVPSLTYVACFQAISATGATIIPCDVREDTLTIDVDDAINKYTSKTRAIVPVHYASAMFDLKKLYKFAKRKKIRVIEDAAHAFGSYNNNKLVGSDGDIFTFSFDGIKNITAGEGGCVVSKDKKVINSVRTLRVLGIEGETQKRYKGKKSFIFNVNKQGWRYHMSNVYAAIGSVQLSRFNTFKRKRRSLAKYYNKLLKNDKRFKLLEYNYNQIVPHIFVVRIPGLKNRSLIIKTLSLKGIESGIHWTPNHYHNFYQTKKRCILKTTEKVFPELLTLPLHPDLSKQDIEYICSELKKIVKRK